jgi:hypothetical protein
MAALPAILVVLLIVCVLGIIVVPGAALIGIPIALVVGVVLLAGLARGAAASRRGSRVEPADVGPAVEDALSSPAERDEEDRHAAASRTTTQG